MRKSILSLASALMLGVLLLAPVPRANAATHVSIDIGVFYRDLAPYGHWVQRHNYGWVWVPRGMPVNWRPYTHGHWVFTDEYGWLWVSDWQWGWAAFHYGRWYFDSDYGWVWVPGREWAPAWVTWRYGDDWIGWAPLPPAAVWYAGSGFRITISSYERYIPPTSWVFVRERQFLHPHVRDYVVIGSRNVVILNHTKNITNYRIVNGRIFNHGLARDRYEQQTRQRVTPYRVRDVNQVRDRQRAPGRGEINVYQPRVQPAPRTARPPAPTPPKAVPPARLNAEQARQMRELSRRQREDRYRVEERYRYEFQHPPQGATPQQLRQRQERELRTLRQEHQRQEQLLQKRQSRERAQDTRQMQRQPQQRQQPQQKQQPQQQQRRKDQRDRNSR